MKIILAPDSFKGNLTASQVAAAMENGIKRVLPQAECIKIPMADGGEGTVTALLDAVGGTLHSKEVQGPLGRKVTARYGLLADNKTAVIEMAEASGLPLLGINERNPLKTTSYGTGELMVDALNKGFSRLIIGLGGSATVDGGVGMAQAFGVQFLDKQGDIIQQQGAGGMLDKIVNIDTTHVHPGLTKATVTAACDVSNLLCGETGAAAIFGPQKGATPEMVNTLDANLGHLAVIIQQALGQDICSMPSAGAGGGLGAGLVAFAGAQIHSGIDVITQATNLSEHLQDADLVITGEGCVDSQTAFGKTPAGVARMANQYGVPVAVMGGGLADDAHKLMAHGISGLVSACARVMSLEEAMRLSPQHIANAAEQLIRLIQIGRAMDTGIRCPLS